MFPLFVVVVVIPYTYNYIGTYHTCQVFSQYSFDISPNNIPITKTDTQRQHITTTDECTVYQHTLGDLARYKLIALAMQILLRRACILLAGRLLVGRLSAGKLLLGRLLVGNLWARLGVCRATPTHTICISSLGVFTLLTGVVMSGLA